MKNKIKLLVLCCACTVSAPSFAIVCANCATSVQQVEALATQADGYAEQLKQTVNQVQSLANQAESISYQIQNLKNIDIHNYGDVKNQINELGSIARQGSSMAYSLSDLTTQWSSQFKGYDEWSNENITNEQYEQQYTEWGDTMRDTAEASLKVAAQMSEVQLDDDDTINALEDSSDNAEGAMQVQQASNEIAVQTTRQLQKLQTLMQTDMQMTATSMAMASEKEEALKGMADAKHEDVTADPTNGTDYTNLYE